MVVEVNSWLENWAHVPSTPTLNLNSDIFLEGLLGLDLLFPACHEQKPFSVHG